MTTAVVPSAPLSMEEYIETVPHEKRNIAITDSKEIAKIAKIIESWECIAPLLGLDDAEVTVIRRNHVENYEEQKLVVGVM